MSKSGPKRDPQGGPANRLEALNCVRGLKNRGSHNFADFLENVVLISSYLKASVRAVRFVYLFSTLQAPQIKAQWVPFLMLFRVFVRNRENLDF